MTVDRITRRRALLVLAAAIATPRSARTRGARPHEWRGTALGAEARLVFWSDDAEAGKAAVDACVAEIERLENIFSLYRTTSEIARLNETGQTDTPSVDIVQLLQLSRKMHASTLGLFDPTVQPLWEFYRDWYAANMHRKAPSDRELSPLLAQVGMDKVIVACGRIFCRGGARLTLNGIAQGYITDRVAEILRGWGWQHVLIDLGEVRTLDGKPDGTPWRVRIGEGPQSLPLAGTALAISAGRALSFDAHGTVTHIFNPVTGRSTAAWRAIIVQHSSAAVADALSTALAVATPEQLDEIAKIHKAARIWAMRGDGTIVQRGDAFPD